MFDFSRGHPNKSLLPVEELQEIMFQQAHESAFEVVQNSLMYNCEEGRSDFLQELADFQDRHTANDNLGLLLPQPQQHQQQQSAEGGGDDQLQHSSSSMFQFDNQLFMTEGVSHGIELLCATQLQAGDTVLVERPTYFLVSNIFHSHRLHVQSLPMKGPFGGVNVQRLATLLASGVMKPPQMIYVIPINQNPTAYTMPIADRHELAALAAKYNILVVADEVYHLLDWKNKNSATNDEVRPARMAQVGRCYENSMIESHDKSSVGTQQRPPSRGCCVSVSAFTKIFAPGIRCGWIEGPEYIIQSLKSYGYIRSQGGCSPVVGELMRCALSNGIADRVLNNLINAYRSRSQTLCDALLRAHGRIHVANPPSGGYFVWVRFPPEIGSASSFLDFCHDKVKFLPGSRCDPLFGRDNSAGSDLEETLSGLKFDEFSLFARLCFADMDEDAIDDGVAALVQCLEQFLLKCKPSD